MPTDTLSGFLPVLLHLLAPSPTYWHPLHVDHLPPYPFRILLLGRLKGRVYTVVDDLEYSLLSQEHRNIVALNRSEENMIPLSNAHPQREVLSGNHSKGLEGFSL